MLMHIGSVHLYAQERTLTPAPATLTFPYEMQATEPPVPQALGLSSPAFQPQMRASASMVSYGAKLLPPPRLSPSHEAAV